MATVANPRGVPRNEADDAGHRSGFPELDGQTLKHRRVVRLKFTPPLGRRFMLDITLTRLHGAERMEWKR
jgi:hypothetical protein